MSKKIIAPSELGERAPRKKNNFGKKSDIMFEIAKENLKDTNNITLLKGDTREHLDSIIANNENILFWLDAHWSGGDTYGEEDECPLIDELRIIFKY